MTRGDNNSFLDSEQVSLKDVVGVVTGFERRCKIYPIHGGKLGLFRVGLLRYWYRFRMVFVIIARYPYRWLRQRRVIAHFWHPNLARIQLITEKGLLIKYIYKRRTIARWWPEKHQFECQKPYDLVVPDPEKSKLP